MKLKAPNSKSETRSLFNHVARLTWKATQQSSPRTTQLRNDAIQNDNQPSKSQEEVFRFVSNAFMNTYRKTHWRVLQKGKDFKICSNSKFAGVSLLFRSLHAFAQLLNYSRGFTDCTLLMQDLVGFIKSLILRCSNVKFNRTRIIQSLSGVQFA